MIFSCSCLKSEEWRFRISRGRHWCQLGNTIRRMENFFLPLKVWVYYFTSGLPPSLYWLDICAAALGFLYGTLVLLASNCELYCHSIFANSMCFPLLLEANYVVSLIYNAYFEWSDCWLFGILVNNCTIRVLEILVPAYPVTEMSH